MRLDFIIVILLILFLSISCKKSSNDDSSAHVVVDSSAIVIVDCSGLYLQINEKDYRVCNIEKLHPFKNATKVIASYRRIKVCDGTATKVVTCSLYHPFEDWIEVLNISPY